MRIFLENSVHSCAAQDVLMLRGALWNPCFVRPARGAAREQPPLRWEFVFGDLFRASLVA